MENISSDSPLVKRDNSSPFQKAQLREKRLKALFWGDSGVGKTTLSLQFPHPVLIDLEGGADLYGDSFDFDVLRASTADQAMEAIDWLGTHQHPYRTLIIDPITVFWDSIQQKWSVIFLRRNKGSKGFKFEFYDLQPRDWQTIKSEFKDFVRKLIALDLNVIVTARQKVKYADSGFMQSVGETFDGEKSLPYLFDTIVRLYRDDQGRFMGECLKDRSNKLPRGEFECSYQVFEGVFGKDMLGREAQPLVLATDEQLQQIRAQIEYFHLTSDQVSKRLSEYNAGNLDELTEENARIILSKFEQALANEGEDHHLRKE